MTRDEISEHEKSCVYMIANRLTGHFYIGSSYRVDARIMQHLSDLRRNKHANAHLQNAFNKHGEEGFYWLPVFPCEPSKLIESEQIYLDLLRPHYNIAPKAGSVRGVKWLHPSHLKGRKNPAASLRNKNRIVGEETRRKHRETMRTRIVLDEWKQAISRGLKGHVVSEATREKIRVAHSGKSPTLETRQRLSKSLTGRVFSQQHRERLSEANRRRIRKISPARPCIICEKLAKPLRNGRCHSCAEYFRRHGHERILGEKSA